MYVYIKHNKVIAQREVKCNYTVQVSYTSGEVTMLTIGHDKLNMHIEIIRAKRPIEG